MDLVLAYKKLVIESKHTIVQKCILGHANGEEKAPIERDNTECDEEANTRVEYYVTPIKFKPQQGYGAML